MRTPICAWYGLDRDYWEQQAEEQRRREEQERQKPQPQPPAVPPAPAPSRAPTDEPKTRALASHALVLGRFMPPHAGHQYLVDTARGLASTVTVLARTTPDDPIDGEHRLAWLRELFGDRIAALTGDAPTDVESPAFWQAWREHVVDALATLPSAARVDLVVSSDRRAWRLAELLGARHVLVDPDRTAVPIAATHIRRDPLGCWAFLPAPVRAHYARRIVLLGPESSGKSTFARELARALDTVLVPEQARLFAERTGTLRATDLGAIAALQAATEDAAARRANRYVICDTDGLSLSLWAERLFGTAAPHAERVPDLYLVTDSSLPFTGRPERDDPAARRAFADRCLSAALASGARVAQLPTDPAARMETALAAIKALDGSR